MKEINEKDWPPDWKPPSNAKATTEMLWLLAKITVLAIAAIGVAIAAFGWGAREVDFWKSGRTIEESKPKR